MCTLTVDLITAFSLLRLSTAPSQMGKRCCVASTIHHVKPDLSLGRTSRMNRLNTEHVESRSIFTKMPQRGE
ncbi:hypothetical protein EDD17DRAFT_1525212 [Pisolithus thermaeus]|nr:hypothetical protein EDD17DRAFT_1525212 [Pisolithus thermaeus]